VSAEPIYDCAIVGAGPAGLTAAVYLARFRRRALLIHDGDSRARWIPRTRNVPGYARGIEGLELLDKLQAQLERYAVDRVPARVGRIDGTNGDFRVYSDPESWRARRVILATGVHDRVPEELHRLWSYVAQGKVRLCPVCDAYEIRDKRIGLLARGGRAEAEARFLANYSADLMVFTHGEPAGDGAARLHRYARAVHESRIVDVDCLSELTLQLEGGEGVSLDTLYVGLGTEVHSGLAVGAGARCDVAGYLQVDQKQQTTAAGIYAAGDVVQSLSQISVAFGQAAIAASAINVALNDEGVRPA
jgi:thioredoxin reductase (NADPH)